MCNVFCFLQLYNVFDVDKDEAVTKEDLQQLKNADQAQLEVLSLCLCRTVERGTVSFL